MKNKILFLSCILLIFLFSVTFVSAGNVIVQDGELNITNNFGNNFIKLNNIYVTNGTKRL